MKARCLKTLEGLGPTTKGQRHCKFFTRGNRYGVLSLQENRAVLMDNLGTEHMVLAGEDGWLQHFKFLPK